MSKKNPGAVALGKRRWIGVSAEEQAEICRKGGKATARKLTKAQRRKRAIAAAEARWAKKRVSDDVSGQ